MANSGRDECLVRAPAGALPSAGGWPLEAGKTPLAFSDDGGRAEGVVNPLEECGEGGGVCSSAIGKP